MNSLRSAVSLTNRDEGEGQQVLEEGGEDGVEDPTSGVVRLSVEAELPVLDAEHDVRPVVVVVVDVVVVSGVIVGDFEADVNVIAVVVADVVADVVAEVRRVDPGVVGQREGHQDGRESDDGSKDPEVTGRELRPGVNVINLFCQEFRQSVIPTNFSSLLKSV